jgi:hypothetical protein
LTRSTRSIQHCISLYADDVVVFLRLEENGITIMLSILKLFGVASRLKTNIQKSNVFLFVVARMRWFDPGAAPL